MKLVKARIPGPTTQCFFKGKTIGGFSLAEVMIAAFIFTLLAVSATTMFVQNQRMVMRFRYRTHVTNAALNLLEQLRLYQYTTIKTTHDTATASTTILTALMDPTYSRPATDPYPASGYPDTGVLDGFRPVPLNLNVLDGTQINSTWTLLNLALENSPTAPKVQARFWMTLNKNISATTPIVQLYELAIIYQWKNPADASSTWQSGTIRLTIPNPNPAT